MQARKEDNNIITAQASSNEAMLFPSQAQSQLQLSFSI